MSAVIADSASCRLAEIPHGGPVSGHRVGVPAGVAGAACLMTLRTADGEVRAAVQAVPLAEVPPGVVAVGDDLAAEWDIDIELARWALERVDPVPVRELVLELPTEREPADAARDITGAGLAGQLLWIPPDGSDVMLAVGDLPHRVRHLDVGGRRGVVAQLTRDTHVEVYASAVRAGVDIVILADCSGSMGVDDLPLGIEGRWQRGPARWMRRMEALQQALRDLLEMRLQISGRVSRIALVEFNHETKRRFPRDGGGMAQLDGGSPADVAEQFRNAVALLRADGGTNIGNALHEAANLLYQHGHTGNERLIVLVSDGADWAPKGERGSGEMVYAVEEPVSLMAHLNRDMGIRLHAIGISTADLFRRRGYPPTPGLLPNHDLLEELVKVGGGDPTTIGGLDVLEDYFSGLGSGISHRVRDGLREPRPAGPLPQPAVAALSRLRAPEPGTQDLDARRSELGYQIIEQVGQCNDQALRALGGPAWDAGRVTAHFQVEVTGQPESVARFLARAAERLRPDPPRHRADALGDLASPLRRLLDRLAEAARDRENVVAAYRAEFGAGDGTGAAVLIDGLARVHDELTRLHAGMRQLPDDHAPEPPSPAAAPDGMPGPAAGFVYKD